MAREQIDPVAQAYRAAREAEGLKKFAGRYVYSFSTPAGDEAAQLQRDNSNLRDLLAELRGEIEKKRAAIEKAEELEAGICAQLAANVEKLEELEADRIDLSFAGYDVPEKVLS